MKKKDEMIQIIRKRVFIRYSKCPMLEDCKDVEVDLPLLPVPGNLFDGGFFLNEDLRTRIDAQHARLFVADVEHEFHDLVQHCIIVLQLVHVKTTPLNQSQN